MKRTWNGWRIHAIKDADHAHLLARIEEGIIAEDRPVTFHTWPPFSREYDTAMKRTPKTPEFQRFETAMKQIMSVSKTEIDARMAADKGARAGKPKRGPKPR